MAIFTFQGPLIVHSKQRYAYIAGVVSYGLGCAHPDYPGVYARVTSAIDWIREKVADENLPVWLRIVPAHHPGFLENDLPVRAIVTIVEASVASLLKLSLQGLGLVVERLNEADDDGRVEGLAFLGRNASAERK